MSRNTAESRRHLDSYRHIPRSEYRVRAIEFARRGEDAAKKLNADIVREIRKNNLGLTDKEQALKYGVSPGTIYKVRNRITWGCVR